jgi:hypothetical protein
VRGADATKPLRSFARLVWYPLQPQTDYFYAGTTHGKRKLLGIGASFDRQGDYSSYVADVFLDHPVAGDNAMTTQLDYWRLDGGALIPDLPRQHALMGEAGFYVASLRLEPYVQVSRRRFSDARAANEAFDQIGLAYWINGDKVNVKLGVGRSQRDHAARRTQVVGQFQVLLW